MYAGKLVFTQIVDHLPLHTFRRCVARYRGQHKVQTFSCLDQYLCMAFAQLTYRESLPINVVVDIAHSLDPGRLICHRP